MIRVLVVSVLLASQAVWVYAQTGMVICFHADGKARTEQAGDLCCESDNSDKQGLSGADQGLAFVQADDCVCSDYAISSANPQVSTTVDVTPVLHVSHFVPSLLEDLASGLVHEPGFLQFDHGPPDLGPLAHLKTVVLRL